MQQLVAGLTLDRYKATLRGLAQFGDRRQGTQRNRDAVQWIAKQLESYGCAPEIMMYTPPQNNAGRGGQRGAREGEHR